MNTSGERTKKTPALAGMWAVCPNAEEIADLGSPKLFSERSAAHTLLQSEFSISKKTYADLKWTEPLSVRAVAGGAEALSTFQEFLPPDAIGNVPDDIQTRILNGEVAKAECFLADSWKFEEIDCESRKCAGHQYELRKHASIAEIVVEAIHDLEMTARSFHPGLSSAAVADFFQSWQVWRYVAELCYEVSGSATGVKLAGSVDRIPRKAHMIFLLVCQQLSSYAHQITKQEPAFPIDPSNNDPAIPKDLIRRLHKDGRRHRDRARALGLADVARRRGRSELWKEAAKAVLEALPADWDRLERILWQPFSTYAELVFDAMAGARLQELGSKVSMRRYTHWLRCTCIPAVLDDVCGGGMGQFYQTGEHIMGIFGDTQSPEDRARTRRIVAGGILTELIGGPHTKNLGQRLTTLLNGRVPHWEAQALDQESGLRSSEPSSGTPVKSIPQGISEGALEPFREDASGRPLGDNPFPTEYPAHTAFEEATWKAKAKIAPFKLELLGTIFNTKAEFIQALLTFRKRWFSATAFETTLIVGNEETAEWYEHWIDDHARWLIEDTLIQVRRKDPKADPGAQAFFSPDDMEQIEDYLTRELLLMVTHYKGVAARRAVESIQLQQAADAKIPTEPLAPVGSPARSAPHSSLELHKWQDLEIRFLSDERVHLVAGQSTETRNYAEFDFEDGRTKKPILAWITLRELAKQDGTIRQAVSGEDWRTVEKRMQEIRKILRTHFQLGGDPIPFVDGVGYRASFKISCAPSFDS
jgi:hypothetical protein